MNDDNLFCMVCEEEVDRSTPGIEAYGDCWFGQCPHCGQRYNNDDPADVMAERGEEGV